jgi:hypothetical protein
MATWGLALGWAGIGFVLLIMLVFIAAFATIRM